jgi:alpha-glucosidase (family GH31 glycosyl hydrolase)
VWSGDPAASFEDSDGLPSVVRAGINLGVSGVPNWGSDIGGYHCLADGAGKADEELLVRWIQLGAISPNMQDQDACAGGDQRQKATIWSSERARDAWRRYARLHTRLFPYFYGLGLAAHASGAPILRHMFLEHPERPELRGVDDQLYVGPAFLAAPVVTRGARTRKLQLPDDVYLDWDTRRIVRGGPGVSREMDAPLERLPLLLRAGQLVPLYDASIDTLSATDAPDVVDASDVADVYDVVVLLEPGKPATAELWDGTKLEAAWDGTEVTGGVVTIETPAGAAATHGGVRVRGTGGRRIRWQVYVAST